MLRLSPRCDKCLAVRDVVRGRCLQVVGAGRRARYRDVGLDRRTHEKWAPRVPRRRFDALETNAFQALGLNLVPYDQTLTLDAVNTLTTGAGWGSIRRGSQLALF